MPRGRLPGWLVPAAAVVVFLGLLIGVDWGSADPIDQRVIDVPDPSIPTESSIPSSSPATVGSAPPPARGDRLEELVPGIDGTLVAVVDQGGGGHSLYLWNPEDSFPQTWPLPADAFSFALSVTGTLFGYLSHGVDQSEGDTLWVTEPGGAPVQVAEHVVGGFRFSGTQPGYLAWIGRDVCFGQRSDGIEGALGVECDLEGGESGLLGCAGNGAHVIERASAEDPDHGHPVQGGGEFCHPEAGSCGCRLVTVT